MKGVKFRKRKIYVKCMPWIFVLTIAVCIFGGVYLSNTFNAYGEKTTDNIFFHEKDINNTLVSYNDNRESEEKGVKKQIIAMEGLSQADIPTGCEAVSTVAVLRYYGISITPEYFIENHLPMKDFYKKNGRVYGADPSKAFAGNPYETGSLGCYCEVIEEACVSMRESNYKGMEKLEIKAVRGNSLSQLEEYVLKGKPVIIWATIDMRESHDGFTYYLETGEQYIWRANEHCVVLCGYDDEGYYIMDPLKAGQIVRYEKTLVEARYEELGKQAVVIERRN